MFQNAHLSLENKDLYLFNKTINAKTQGTLVGNWYEERELNQITGERRALPHEHFPKSHNELFRKPPNEIEFLKKRREVEKIDNTNERIMGRKINENYNSQNSEYGKNKNKADELAKVGRKYELLQRQFIDSISEEFQSKENNRFDEKNIRHFNVTSLVDFGPKDIKGNTLGRRVMKDPSLNQLEQNNRDEDFLVEHGLIQRAPFLDEEILKQKVSNQPYYKQTPLTFYTEKIEDGCYYMSSKGEKRNPFGLNNDFVKNFPQYKHYKN